MQNLQTIIPKIKKKKWDNRVKRTGFLQSKVIAAEAQMQPVELVKGIALKYDNFLWVKDFALYDEKATDAFSPLFKKAFEKEPQWPLRIIKNIDSLYRKKDLLKKKLQKKSPNVSSATLLFKEYVELLHSIQKHYVIAVPLTNYCEVVLTENKISYSELAVPLKQLDIDFYNKSLKKIAGSAGNLRKKLMKKNLKEFGWIKTAYNIVETYTETELLEALKSAHPDALHKPLPSNRLPELLALQAGIFIRNRIKELSQQIWFAFEPVGRYLAQSLEISRDDFFALTPSEVFRALKIGKSPVSPFDLKDRHTEFVIGFVDGQFILLTGKSARELLQFFDPEVSDQISEFKGSIACKGIVSGICRIIRTKNEFNKLGKGEILVTSMTTPDFVLIMKKSAAIVTDEGGLSCHAAIVSRELNIPCIIGTKVATKVLKDGDEVEIDANTGIVRIIRRASVAKRVYNSSKERVIRHQTNMRAL